MLFAEGQPARRLRERRAHRAQGRRHAGADPAGVALREGRTRPCSSGARAAGTATRRSRILGSGRTAAAARSLLIASVSTLVFFGAIVARRRQLARLGRGAGRVLLLAGVQGVVPGHPREVLDEREAVPHGRGVHPRLGPRARRAAEPAGAGVLPAPDPLGRVHGRLPRDPDDPAHLPARLRRAGAADQRRAALAVLLGRGLARARLLGVRGRGLPRGDRIGASEPGGGGALARAHALPGAAARRPAAGDPARRPAAAERLHRADRRTPRSSRCSVSSRRSGSRRSRSPARSTTRRTSRRR